MINFNEALGIVHSYHFLPKIFFCVSNKTKTKMKTAMQLHTNEYC